MSERAYQRLVQSLIAFVVVVGTWCAEPAVAAPWLAAPIAPAIDTGVPS